MPPHVHLLAIDSLLLSLFYSLFSTGILFCGIYGSFIPLNAKPNYLGYAIHSQVDEVCLIEDTSKTVKIMHSALYPVHF